ncbi:MAG TPA: hypothetical protein VGK96_23880, partial [Candidatus Sulfotelmatobacter sp.]
ISPISVLALPDGAPQLADHIKPQWGPRRFGASQQFKRNGALSTCGSSPTSSSLSVILARRGHLVGRSH